MSTIHKITCSQMTMSLRNHCRDVGVVQQPPPPQQLLHIMDLQMGNPALKDTTETLSSTGVQSSELGGDISGGWTLGVSLCSKVTVGAFNWDIRQLAGNQLSTGAQWNAFGRLMGHTPAAEKCRGRELGCTMGASDTIMFTNGYHRN